MMLQILLHDRLGDLTRTPRAVADAPERTAPVALLQRRVLLQKTTGAAALDAPHDLADRVLRPVGQVQMHVIARDDALENSNVERVADLPNEVAAALLDLPPKHAVAVLRAEDNVDLELEDGMTAVTLLHAWQPTESLVLKHVASTSAPKQ